MKKQETSALTMIREKTETLSGYLGISTESFRKKLEKREGEEFTLGQLRKIARECRLSTGEIADIFLK